MIRSISYVLKYVNKGSDKLTFVVRSDNATHDEIETYRTARYVGSNEAVWRILSFDIHANSPSVIILTIHLPGQQLIYYDEARPVDLSVAPITKLTKFFDLCSTTASASNLIYTDVPTNYVWDSKLNKWSARKRTAKLGQLGRISIISPRAGELFYLRLLLCYRKCPKSFLDLRTVNSAVYETFKLAANATGLLDNDDYLRKALIEANNRIPQYRMRRLFAVLLYHCEPQDPKQLWEEFKHKMCLDFMNRSHVGPPTATMIEKCLALITHHYRHIGGDLNCFPLETLASDVIENYALSFMTILANQRVDTESPTTIDDLNVEQKEVSGTDRRRKRRRYLFRCSRWNGQNFPIELHSRLRATY